MSDESDRSVRSRRWLLGGLTLPAIVAGITGLTPLDALAATRKKKKRAARAAAAVRKPKRVVTRIQKQQPRLALQQQPRLTMPYGANNGAPLNAPVRQLALYNKRNGESLRTVYFANGRYQDRGMADLRSFMRDWRSDEETDVDPRLADLLWSLQRRLVPNGSVDMVCGYRSPATNALLRRTNRGVALNSFHMYGKAMDIRITDVPLRALHDTAESLGLGGVGYYPSSNFVHVDTGPVRQWGQGRGWGA